VDRRDAAARLQGRLRDGRHVDYLFGYDATAGVVDDWMYEKLAQSYVFDETNRAFMQKSNPWALRGVAERLLEAADRGCGRSRRPRRSTA
jgi:cobalamin biosynthesis Mg chelatase CobN